MAANDDFPRGWIITSAPAVNVQMIITIPAVPGISHVIDTVTARVYNGTGALVGEFLDLFVGSTRIFQWNMVALSGQVDEVAFPLGIVAPQNTAVTLELETTGANITQMGIMTGHDI